MPSIWVRIKIWWNSAKKYIWVFALVYILHLTIEGLAVNLMFYKVIQPLYYSMV